MDRLKSIVSWAILLCTFLATVALAFTIAIYLVDWSWAGWGLVRSFAFLGACIGLVVGSVHPLNMPDDPAPGSDADASELNAAAG